MQWRTGRPDDITQYPTTSADNTIATKHGPKPASSATTMIAG